MRVSTVERELERRQFAARAMQGLLANNGWTDNIQWIVDRAVTMAEAMQKELDREYAE